VLTVAAAVWTTGYLGLYLGLISGEGDAPAWWYVGLLVVAIVLLVRAAARPPGRGALVAAVVVLGVGTLIAGFSIGLALLPAWVAGIAALVTSREPRAPRLGAPGR
jgi:hypothetical protein